MKNIEMEIIRAGAWMVMILCLIAIVIILDIWKHRREVRSPDIVVMVMLTISIIAVAGVFGRCAWTGVFPCSSSEARP